MKTPQALRLHLIDDEPFGHDTIGSVADDGAGLDLERVADENFAQVTTAQLLTARLSTYRCDGVTCSGTDVIVVDELF